MSKNIIRFLYSFPIVCRLSMSSENRPVIRRDTGRFSVFCKRVKAGSYASLWGLALDTAFFFYFQSPSRLQNRWKIVAAWARVVLLPGANSPVSSPLMSPAPMAQCIGSRA